MTACAPSRTCAECGGPCDGRAEKCRACRWPASPRPRTWKGAVIWTQPVPDGHLLVACWCQKGAAFVTKRDVANGLTGSCGRPDCTIPQEYEEA